MKVKRTKGRSFVTISLVSLLIVPAAFAQKGKPAPTSIPLNLEFAPGYSIAGDGQTYSDATQNVRAEILENGNFILDTNENKGDGGRRVVIAFPAGFCAPVDGIPCPTSGMKDVFAGTLSISSSEDNLATLTLGQYWDKRCAITWAEGAYSYHLQHNGSNDGIHTHGYLRFTCTATDVNGCSQWSASPASTVGLYGNLTRGNGSSTYLATLSLPFQVTLTKK